MIRNTYLKKVLVDYVFPVFSLINKIVPKNDRIIFIYNANGPLNDNSKVICDYLLENAYDKKYKIISGSDPIKDSKYRNVKFSGKIESLFTYMVSGHVLYSMGKIPIKPTKHQYVINMWHGAPTKLAGKNRSKDSGEEFFFTYVCATSEFYKRIMAKTFGCPLQNVVINGDPKADKLFIPKKVKDYKYVIWTPTFRQSSFLGHNDSSLAELLPLIKKEEWDELDEILDTNAVRMLVKLHPMQDTKGFKKRVFRNLKIYSDSAFQNEGMDIFEELSQADALISDYSSVYLNYLLLNRPIAFALPDIEEYAKTRGLVFDNPYDFMPGPKCKSKEDLYKFITEISKGIDNYEQERLRVDSIVNKYHDGKNCERLLKIANIKK